MYWAMLDYFHFFVLLFKLHVPVYQPFARAVGRMIYPCSRLWLDDDCIARLTPTNDNGDYHD